MNHQHVVTLFALVVGVAANTPLGAQSPSRPSTVKAADSTYLALLRPLRETGDTSVDVTALRRALAATSFYSPYDYDRDEQRHRMWSQLDANDAAAAAALADSLLSTNYLDFDSQIGAGAAAKALGDSVSALRHFAIARAIVRSIESTGDGHSREHPLFVIAPSEEYSYLSVTGLRRSGMQALSDCGGRACDMLEVTPRDGGQQLKLYFDVSLPMTWMTKQFSEGEKDTKGSKP